MKKHIIHVNNKKCIGCGICKKDCPVNNISILEKKAVILEQDCIKCGHCVAICPRAAVSMTGFDEQPIEIEKPVQLNPQQLLKAIKTRRTIRQFKNQPIEQDIITQIIESGRFTPSGGNLQNVSYIVLQDKLAHYEKMAVSFFKKLFPIGKLLYPSGKRVLIDKHFFFKNAPIVIMILSKDKVNGALAASNMELMSEAYGLGVMYSGFFTTVANVSPSLRKSLGLKRKDKVVTTLVLGYPNVTYYRTVQKDRASVRLL